MPNQVDFGDGSNFDELLNLDEGDVTTNNEQNPDENITDVDAPNDDSVLNDDSEQYKDNDTPTNDNFLVSFLGEYGLKDGVVKYENDDGSIEEVNFEDLDPNEKLNVLKQITTPDLNEDEISIINYLRTHNTTLQNVLDEYSQKAIQAYIDQNGPIQKTYTIDDYSDDELYIADLKIKYSDMTDDEIKTDLEAAKENEELFKKKVDTIRKQYKEQEDAEAAEATRSQEEQMNNFRTSIQDQLKEFKQVSLDYKDAQSGFFRIDDTDRNEIYKYIMEQDSDGYTQFFKDLNDPAKLVKYAWFAKYGEQAISDITNYWKRELKNTRKAEKQVSTAQTVVRKPDKQDKKDDFVNRRNVAESFYGESLL